MSPLEATDRGWTFLTNHAAVLLTIHRATVLDGRSLRVRDIAARVGVTERTVQNILNELEDSGYIVRHHVGRRTKYRIRRDQPLRRPDDDDYVVGMLLDTLTNQPDGAPGDDHEDGRARSTPDDRSGLIAAGQIDRNGIDLALRALRTHLDLDVAFVSHVRDGHRVFTHVDTDSGPAPIEVGGSDPAEDSYCHYVIRGEIPQLLTDPAQHPLTSRLAATEALPVGTHLSVPIELADGETYGTCCTFSYDVREHIDDRDLAAVRVLAHLVATHLDHDA